LAALETSLQEDLAWRRKELSSLYLSVISASPQSESQYRAIRSGIVLTYAHLEGFTRQAARCYFEYVRGRNLTYGDLALNFLALKISRIVCHGTTKASYYSSAVDLLTLKIGETAILPEPEVITANSSLKFAQFKEILYCINIDPHPFSSKENFFDKVLLERRNAIAHGEFRRPSPDDYHEIHVGVIEILDQLDTRLIDAATGEDFRRA
jgi:hypothetical protein